ncbi:MAG: hypothetical protein KF765_09755 [Parvibaculaceae bacterium]|nr:hypothetical protein [Parvibaculaceae bacterium]
MRAIHIQRFLAFIFLGLGGWAMFMPGMVERLGMKPEYYVGNATSSLFIACFGAQAVLVGVVILTSKFLPRTFLIFGLCASIPFFIFNYYFYFVLSMFNEWMLLDFAGNLAILACGILGYRLSLRERDEGAATM